MRSPWCALRCRITGSASAAEPLRAAVATTTRESWRARLTRWGFNWFPAYRLTGARLTWLADDWHEVRLRLPLNWQTRNVVGTIFGGSMYGALDPVFMIMLMRLLGPGYVVWDKSATIHFRRPGREQLFATFRLAPEEAALLRAAVDAEGKVEREYSVELVNAAGEVHATCVKLLSVRRKERLSG